MIFELFCRLFLAENSNIFLYFTGMSDIITIDITERRIEDRDLMTGNQGNIITQADVGLLRHQEGILFFYNFNVLFHIFAVCRNEKG